MSVWIKRIIYSTLVLAVAAGFYTALGEKPLIVDSAIVKLAPMQIAISADGVARVKDVYTIFSPISGHLDRSTLNEGQPVTAGNTVVALIHPLDPPFLDQRTRSELTAAIEAAQSSVAVVEAQLDSAQSTLTLARSEYRRSSKLAQTNLITESAMDRAYSNVQLREAEVTRANALIRLRRAELVSAKARLLQPGDVNTAPTGEECCVSLMSPIDGKVLQVFARSEQAVSTGARIAQVGDPGKLEIVVDLLSSDATRIKPGIPAEIVEWGGERTLAATVRVIEPSAFTKISALGIEEQRVNAVLDLEDSPPALGHNYRVVVRLVVWSADEVLQLPIGALFRANGEWAVFAVDGEHAVIRNIKIGKMNETNAEILEGLVTGQVVILYPNDLLEHGSLVALRSE